MSRFKVDTFNGVYEVNVVTSFKNLNSIKLCTPLNISILNHNYKIYLKWRWSYSVVQGVKVYFSMSIYEDPEKKALATSALSPQNN
jgi:hypothetical protein